MSSPASEPTSPAAQSAGPRSATRETLRRLDDRHTELLAKIDDLNEQILSALQSASPRAANGTE
ncbi:MAG: hypothetical protein AAGB00_09420 [Planctomycetota bacterium]